MATNVIDKTKGVTLTQKEMDSINTIFTVAAKIDKAGFVIKPNVVYFCPLAWLVIEVAGAAAHYCFEESHFGGGDIAIAQKAYEETAARLKVELKQWETKSGKKGAQLLTEFKNYLKK